jgi:O-antigen/teichoic acid export membrane protein
MSLVDDPVRESLAGSPCRRRARDRAPAGLPRVSGLSWAFGSELLAGALGIVVMVHLARRLGPPSFARVEYAAAVAAWLLVVVRGGMDVIATREAARRTRLVRPLTDALVSLRCLAAVAGYLLVLGVAALVGRERGAVIAVAGLLLFPSALVTDVGLRAAGRLRWLALSQAFRGVGYTLAVLGLVRGPADAFRAAWCLVLGECLVAVVPLVVHAAEYGLPRPRLRRRLAAILVRRGLVAGLIRFGRVTLYGADLLALGIWAGPDFGTYAAARRLVFGLVALGLVVPASVAPMIARGWAEGARTARDQIGEALQRLWMIGLPASLGLALTADRWMPMLFGAGYQQGGPWLALIAARLPWLLTASFDQSALVACRRENWVLDQMFGLIVLAAMVVPLAAYLGGPWGVGWAALTIEVVAAVGGWRLLARLGVAPDWHHGAGPAVVASVAMAIVCQVLRPWPLWTVVLAAGVTYVVTLGTIPTGRVVRGLGKGFVS